VVVTFLMMILALAVAYVERRFVAHELALAETQSHFRAVVASAPWCSLHSTLTGPYLNNIVEQDHRRVKRRLRPMLGLKSFGHAAITIAGVTISYCI
jgi:transposase-like protein